VKRSLVLVLFTLVGLVGSVAWASSAREDSAERLQNAANALNEIMSAPDKGIPEEVLDNAKCVLVIPHLVKGGFIIGGKHGRGVGSCRTKAGWSAPAFISVGGGSAGLQIGVEGVDLVMLVMNNDGLQHLLSSKFQISGEGSAAAGPVGRHASAGTDWKMNAELLTYSRSKGAFAGLTLEGAVIEPDSDSTIAIYGKDESFRKVLLGEVAAPASAAPFMAALQHASHKASEHEAKEEVKDDKK
jgi:lipid-binding SYLF domain-containing protein